MGVTDGHYLRASAAVAPDNLLVPNESVIAACQTGGMCLGACPTYELSRDPDESPRGRIRLIKAVSDRVLALDDPRFLEHTWSCLLCRACETVCPSAAPYHELAVAARAQLVRNELVPPRRRPAVWMLRHVFARPRCCGWWRRWLAGSSCSGSRRSHAERRRCAGSFQRRPPGRTPQHRRVRLRVG